jgi:glycosyltransferase involved in cell wall biosynthesis
MPFPPDSRKHNKMLPEEVWFWQSIISPHMAGLAEALAKQGRKVTYVAELPMSAERAQQGWHVPVFSSADLRLAPASDSVAKLVADVPTNSIHICQGLRANGQVGAAQRFLARRRLRQWVVAETVEKKGSWLASRIKRLEYARLVHSWRDRIEGILAIGETTPGWFCDRGMPRERIFPFAYFLPEASSTGLNRSVDAPFRILFVGRIVPLKRLDILIQALARLRLFSFELAVVGAGPLMEQLALRGREQLGDRVIWLGQQPMRDVPALMEEADCLVLPSNYDGWGAVVSEALMMGTPAICSDRCGVAVAVCASGAGGVFRAGDVDALTALLATAIAKGRQTYAQRAALAKWARCLGATAGASYLNAILCHNPAGARPLPPWEVE